MRVGGGSLLLTLVFAAMPAPAQVIPYECPVGASLEPEGRWLGPYEFSKMGPSIENVQEIAHAAVLPPAAGEEDDIRVLLWCRPTYDVNDLRPARTFLWKPSRPGAVETLPIPNSDPQAQTDPFCAGHTFASNGDLLIFGGLNVLTQVDGCSLFPCITDGMPCTGPYTEPYGHRAVYRLDTSVDPPVWDTNSYEMLRERWYPTPIAMHDETILVSGHSGEPSPSCDTPNCIPCLPSPPWLDPFASRPSGEVREFFAGPVVVDIERHQRLGQDCVEDVEHEHDDYPRLHLLANKWLLHTNDHDLNQPQPPIPRTRLMNVFAPACASDPEMRWEDAGNPLVDRHGGGSVHFIVRDGPLFDPQDVVYAIGGVEHYGDAQCGNPPNPSTASVEKMIDPQPGRPWLTAPSLPDMGDPGDGRGSHNSVILLDGSILVVGGSTYVAGDNCYGFGTRTAVRYHPPEIFRDIVPGSAEDVWHLMATQAHARRYHSVAGVLPDGRVFSAGGEAPDDAMHSLEIYEPDYYADPNRPIITSAPSVIVLGEDALDTGDVAATICQYREVGRVVLLRNGSMTHAFDFHQRYVELDWQYEISSPPPPNVVIDIAAPEDEFVAPPGWYLLVVIDDEEIPSEGRWVQVVPPGP